jgi:hypothetical protein
MITLLTYIQFSKLHLVVDLGLHPTQPYITINVLLKDLDPLLLAIKLLDYTHRQEPPLLKVLQVKPQPVCMYLQEVQVQADLDKKRHLYYILHLEPQTLLQADLKQQLDYILRLVAPLVLVMDPPAEMQLDCIFPLDPHLSLQMETNLPSRFIPRQELDCRAEVVLSHQRNFIRCQGLQLDLVLGSKQQLDYILRLVGLLATAMDQPVVMLSDCIPPQDPHLRLGIVRNHRLNCTFLRGQQLLLEPEMNLLLQHIFRREPPTIQQMVMDQLQDFMYLQEQSVKMQQVPKYHLACIRHQERQVVLELETQAT